MAGYRQNRINEQLVQELADILRTVKDPRVSGSFVSITGAECSADLKMAKIYFSAVGENIDTDEIKKGFLSAAGYIRKQIAQRLNLRVTPELHFYADNSMERGARISELLRMMDSGSNDEVDENDT